LQFKVPQNIDLEDKIVGPLTLVQFLYLLGGGLIVYILFQSIGTKSTGIFVILALPISIVSLGMAFVKIQDQPLSHFIKAGIYYYTHPKTRFWRKVGFRSTVLIEPPKKVRSEVYVQPKKIEKSDLEKLAHTLDTGPLGKQEQQNFGRITNNFEKLIQQGMGEQKTQAPRQGQGQGGQVGNMGQPPTAGK